VTIYEKRTFLDHFKGFIQITGEEAIEKTLNAKRGLPNWQLKARKGKKDEKGQVLLSFRYV